MNIWTQISSRQTEPASRSGRKASTHTPSLRDKEWRLSTSIICLGLTVLVWHTGNPRYAVQTVQTAEISPGEDRPFDHVVTGTLDQLDFDARKGLLKTDLGKPIFFDMARPELFQRLSVGQRVTIGMNEQGQAVKVMEIPPVEIPHPPTSP